MGLGNAGTLPPGNPSARAPHPPHGSCGRPPLAPQRCRGERDSGLLQGCRLSAHDLFSLRSRGTFGRLTLRGPGDFLDPRVGEPRDGPRRVRFHRGGTLKADSGSGLPRASPYAVFMLVLCVAVLVALAVEAVVPLDPEVRRVLLAFDTVAALLFMADFLGALYRAEDRRQYLLTWGWIDFLSSIPSVAVLRWGRTARIARLLRVLRGVRSARFLASVVLSRRSQSVSLGAVLVAVLTLFLGAAGAILVERPAGGNITTAEDALWWAFVTMSTAGFGDHYPITAMGRIIGVILMTVGIGVFGTVTALVASWILGERSEQGDPDERR